MGAQEQKLLLREDACPLTVAALSGLGSGLKAGVGGRVVSQGWRHGLRSGAALRPVYARAGVGGRRGKVAARGRGGVVPGQRRGAGATSAVKQWRSMVARGHSVGTSDRGCRGTAARGGGEETC